jgi:hypothetical protein
VIVPTANNHNPRMVGDQLNTWKDDDHATYNICRLGGPLGRAHRTISECH